VNTRVAWQNGRDQIGPCRLKTITLAVPPLLGLLLPQVVLLREKPEKAKMTPWVACAGDPLRKTRVVLVALEASPREVLPFSLEEATPQGESLVQMPALLLSRTATK